MCELCEKTDDLLKQTKGLNSGDFTHVEFTIPGGEPRLIRAKEDNGQENS